MILSAKIGSYFGLAARIVNWFMVLSFVPPPVQPHMAKGRIVKSGERCTLLLSTVCAASVSSGMEIDMKTEYVNKKQQERLNRQKSDEKFNSITQKVKPENQNQTHNVRSEAVEPKNRQV